MTESTDMLLGKLIESVAGLRRDITDLRGDFDLEKDHAHESRKDVHRKIDNLAERVADVETTVQVAGHVSAQTRNVVETTKVEISARIDALEPTVNDFKRMRSIGIGIVGIVAIGGTAFGASLIWWGEQTVTAIRGFLRIP